MDPEKIDATTEFNVPKSLKAVRSFLVLCGWYRKFIGNFTAVTAPLTDLLSTGGKFLFNRSSKRF